MSLPAFARTSVLLIACAVACGSESDARSTRAQPAAPPTQPAAPQEPAPVQPVEPAAPIAEPSALPPPPVVTADASWRLFRDARCKVSLRYPAHYLIDKRNAVEGGLRHLVLIEDDQFARDYIAGRLTDGEGPMQIAISFGPNELKGESLEHMAKAQLGEQAALADVRAVQVAGMPAVRFQTDDLWQAETILIAQPSCIVRARVDFNAPDDAIRADLHGILATLQFEP